MTTSYPGDRELRAAAADLAAELPPTLQPLAAIAYDYRWSWSQRGRHLFERIDPERWTRTGHNPVRILDETPRRRLQALAGDAGFLREVDGLRAELATPPATREGAWDGTVSAEHPVAFLCAEFGVHLSLPVYSGGLGTLAGDLLKEASDRGFPMVGVGVLYRSGSFHQRVDVHGTQHEYWLDTDPERLPMVLVTGDDGAPVQVRIPIADEEVAVQVWRAAVGDVPLYLLDSDVPGNSSFGRWVTARLYEGNPSIRLAQYAVLGVGAVQALDALGVRPALYHLNEGHPALAVVELVERARRGGAPFDAAWAAARSQVVSTTHTPVPAGNETYAREEVLAVLGRLLERSGEAERWLAAGRIHPEDPAERSGMTVLAMRASRSVNAVSRRHGGVARAMWQPLHPGRSVDEVPITHVTNGVHVPTWLGGPMRRLLDAHLGPGWMARADDPATWAALDGVPDAELWQARNDARRELVALIRERVTRDRLRRGEGVRYASAAELGFDDDVLTIGFARRLAEYKRLHLVATDPARVVEVLQRPVQFVVAGKAHPQDEGAKRIVEQLFAIKGSPEVAGRVAFLEDYDMALAAALVAGCDVWVNLPRPPMEASGTSGMKAVLNGGLHLSVLDGWWAEAYDGANGWAIDGAVDPDVRAQDAAHAAAFYDLLLREVVPLFRDRRDGLPAGWVAMVRRSMCTNGPRVAATRMLREYATRIYRPPTAP